MPRTTTNGRGFRARITFLLAEALGIYTRYVPFSRGRGIFIRTIERLERRGWPAPLVRIGHGLVMELEPGYVARELRGEYSRDLLFTRSS